MPPTVSDGEEHDLHNRHHNRNYYNEGDEISPPELDAVTNTAASPGLLADVLRLNSGVLAVDTHDELAVFGRLSGPAAPRGSVFAQVEAGSNSNC